MSPSRALLCRTFPHLSTDTGTRAFRVLAGGRWRPVHALDSAEAVAIGQRYGVVSQVVVG